MKTVVPEKLRVDLKKGYKDALHQMIDSVDDEETLLYLFTFDRLYIEDAERERRTGND